MISLQNQRLAANLPRMSYGQAPSLSNAQIYRLYAFIAQHGKNAVRDNALMAISLRAGLRACELAGLTVGDVCDGEQLREVVRLRIAKGREFDEAYLVHADVQEYAGALLAWHIKWGGEDDAPFFVSARGSGFTADNMRKHIARLFSGAGIQGRSHSGRRSFATHLDEKGASARVIQKLMRHNSIAMTMRYIDASPARLIKAVAGL